VRFLVNWISLEYIWTKKKWNKKQPQGKSNMHLIQIYSWAKRDRHVCRNLSFGRRATRDSRVRVPRKQYARSRYQRLFEENVGKTEKDVVYKLLVKGSGVVFTHGEGISTPHVRHKGR